MDLNVVTLHDNVVLQNGWEKKTSSNDVIENIIFIRGKIFDEGRTTFCYGICKTLILDYTRYYAVLDPAVYGRSDGRYKGNVAEARWFQSFNGKLLIISVLIEILRVPRIRFIEILQIPCIWLCSTSVCRPFARITRVSIPLQTGSLILCLWIPVLLDLLVLQLFVTDNEYPVYFQICSNLNEKAAVCTKQ